MKVAYEVCTSKVFQTWPTQWKINIYNYTILQSLSSAHNHQRFQHMRNSL